MILLTILLFIFARSLYHNISPIVTSRMAALAFIYALALTFNALYIQIIGSGIGIYCGLFKITYYSLFIESFIYLIGSIILLSWGLIYNQNVSNVVFDLLSANPSTFTNTDATIKTEINNAYRTEVTVSGLSHEGIQPAISLKSDTSTDVSNYSENPFDLENSDLNKKIKSIGTSSEARDYSLISLFSVLGSSFLISSGDLLSMYLSIELQSFGLYILATIYRESGSATSAGLKYFLLGGLSSCLILLGTGLIYAVTGLTDFNSIYSIISVLSSMPSSSSVMGSDSLLDSYTLTENFNLGLSLGFIFIIVGFLFKIAAAPFHNWAPSVYDESPTNVTIWLTIMPKIAILLFLLEIYGNISLALPLDTDLVGADLNLNTGLAIKNIFLLSSLLSLIIGTVVGLAQIKIKRLFAYSTISHVGFLLLALAINTEQSTESFLFYLIQYTITNLNAFFILLAFGYIINNLIKSNYINSDLQNISDLKGQFVSNPILSLSLTVCLFSMAGINRETLLIIES
jgi:NADH-ubiquinone oxidoreductase chain 2